MPAPLDLASYECCLHENFTARFADGSAREFLLVEAVSRIENPTQRAFTLLFTCEDLGLPTGQYALTHPRLGAIDLFLVPVLWKRGRLAYEAVFNLLKDEQP